MPTGRLLLSKRLLWFLGTAVALVIFACSRYPSTPRGVVIGFVRATQSEDGDVKSYLLTSIKNSLSMKGLKYTFGDSEVQQSVPQAEGKYAVLVKKVRLGAGTVVIATDMRVDLVKEKNHWVISRLVAGVTEPAGNGDNDWLKANGIPLR